MNVNNHLFRMSPCMSMSHFQNESLNTLFSNTRGNKACQKLKKYSIPQVDHCFDLVPSFLL